MIQKNRSSFEILRSNIQNIIHHLKQFFCKHDFRMKPECDDYKERNEMLTNLKDEELISFSRMHVCKECGMERMINSGRGRNP